MEEYYVEARRLYNGFPTTTTCNFQEHRGKRPVAKLHIHDKIEIIYCTSGGYEAVLCGVSYNIKKGDILLINSCEMHKTFSKSDGVNSLWVIQFDSEIIYNASQSIFETQYALPFTSPDAKHPRVITAEEMQDSPMSGYIHQIIEEHDGRRYGHELAIRGCICQMMLWIIRHWKQTRVELDGSNIISDKMMAALKTVFDYVDEHYGEDISVEELAKYCNMSYSYFSRQFKKIMNISFTDYLKHVRISKAEIMLSQSDKNVTEVALAVGFSNSAYFIQKFKQVKGCSPNRFKKFCKL